MRYFFAILTLVIAGILLVLGVGQRTFLSGPSSVQIGVNAQQLEDGFAVIPAAVFDQLRGQPSVVLTGDQLFVAIGSSRDIEGWMQGQNHSVLSLGEGGEELEVQAVRTTEPAMDNNGDESESEIPDPRGSDMWLDEFTGESSLKVAVDLEPSQAVLAQVASDTAADATVQVSWAREKNTPLAGPLLVTGGIFAALGAILYLFALDHDRRGLGPRRGRKGPFQGLRNRRPYSSQTASGVTKKAMKNRRLSLLAGAGAAALMVGLAGCSPSYWPQPVEPSPSVEAQEPTDELRAPVPVVESQIDMITARISEVANTADSDLDSDVLKARFTGPAFDQRSANFTIRSAEPDYQVPPRILSERLDYTLIQSTENWPRTMFITVDSSMTDPADSGEEESSEETEGESNESAGEGEESTPTLALLVTQSDPRSNYMTSHVISLRGGIEMPPAAPLSEGTALLSDDLKTLQLEPRMVSTAFADVLQAGQESEWYDLFALDDEILLDKMGAAWANQQSGENVNYSASVKATEVPVVSLSTGQGGALVIASVFDDHITASDGERYRVELSKIEQALGLSGSQERVVQRWLHDVLFYVPSAESGDKIVILGSSSEIVSASS